MLLLRCQVHVQVKLVIVTSSHIRHCSLCDSKDCIKSFLWGVNVRFYAVILPRFVTMLSDDRSVMTTLEWDEGYAMPVADSANKQLEKQVFIHPSMFIVMRNICKTAFSLRNEVVYFLIGLYCNITVHFSLLVSAYVRRFICPGFQPPRKPQSTQGK